MTSASAQALLNEIMPTIDAVVQAAVDRALTKVTTQQWIPAVVTAVSGSTIDVRVDSPSDEDPADVQGVNIGPLPDVGDRVMTVQVPPFGLYIIGVVLPG